MPAVSELRRSVQVTQPFSLTEIPLPTGQTEIKLRPAQTASVNMGDGELLRVRAPFFRSGLDIENTIPDGVRGYPHRETVHLNGKHGGTYATNHREDGSVVIVFERDTSPKARLQGVIHLASSSLTALTQITRNQ